MKNELAGEAKCLFPLRPVEHADTTLSSAELKSKSVPTNLFHKMHLRWYAFGVDHFLKHVDHVVELSVDIADDDHGLLHS